MQSHLPTSAQYRLGVQIGHLLAASIRDGMTHQQALETLAHQAAHVSTAAELGNDFASYTRKNCPVCGAKHQSTEAAR